MIKLEYSQSGESIKPNNMGMRKMQELAFEKREMQYLLLKSPPASGKSRAIMFVALDKLINQGIKKVIIAVPERNIGKSFSKTNLVEHGFFADWKPEVDLCFPGTDESKVSSFIEFMNDNNKILICTHATLRISYKQLSDQLFDNCLLVIDEFHHISSDNENNKLGDVVHNIMVNSSAHIIGSTGSYFRGDGVPVLHPEDESKFDKVVFNYYDQLNGYKYLKSLGIDYYFYQGKYTDSIREVLDINKKTIVHIPSVNSGEALGDKYSEVDEIISVIGEHHHTDSDNIIHVKTRDGRNLKVADLVFDEQNRREKVIQYLQTVDSADDIDIIIALRMAKEGFDWPWCEHALTIGYRGSLTEVVQIIGRCTRDCKGKNHAQYTNLIAQPDVDNDDIKISVNSWFKAITCSLLMEQVLAPNLKILSKRPKKGDVEPGTVIVEGLKELPGDIAEKIDIEALKEVIYQNESVIRNMSGSGDAEYTNTILIPSVIRERYPDYSEEAVEAIRDIVVADTFLKRAKPDENGFIRMAGQFIKIDELDINLINRINPFQDAYEIKAKSLTPVILSAIQDAIKSMQIQMTEEEAILLYKKTRDRKKIEIANGNEEWYPDINSADQLERRMAEALTFLKGLRRKYKV